MSLTLERHRAPCSPLELIATLAALGAAAVSPLIFVVAAAGYSTMRTLALYVLLPAAGLLGLCLVAGLLARWQRLYRDVSRGIWIGAAATVGLEIARIIGFRVFHAMPGSLPMLMGVLITDHFMQGPTLLSDLIGWGYHFWNGACFGIIYMLTYGRRPWWVGVAYGLAVGVGFLASPIVVMTGAGRFGSEVSPGFAVTVLVAHCLFGGIMGLLASRERIDQPPVLLCLVDFHGRAGMNAPTH